MPSWRHFINLSTASALAPGLGAIASGVALPVLALMPSARPPTLLNILSSSMQRLAAQITIDPALGGGGKADLRILPMARRMTRLTCESDVAVLRHLRVS